MVCASSWTAAKVSYEFMMSYLYSVLAILAVMGWFARTEHGARKDRAQGESGVVANLKTSVIEASDDETAP